MATMAPDARGMARDDRFFLITALCMAFVVVAGFSTQLAMGRSTFASPLRVHLHAVLFMGWVAIYVAQAAFAATGSIALHRRLGWVAAGWIVAMVVLGFVVTLAKVQEGRAPFFFTPLQFLVLDPIAILTFAGLTIAAIANRRRTDWHRRLHYCGMAVLLGPAFGRLMPLPLFMPWAYEANVASILIFPVIGVIADIRRNGIMHPAWHWGIGTILASTLLVEAIISGPLGLPLYRAVTAGTPGALVAPLEHPAPPSRHLHMGRPPAI